MCTPKPVPNALASASLHAKAPATVVVFQPGLTDERFESFNWSIETIERFYRILSKNYKLLEELGKN